MRIAISGKSGCGNTSICTQVSQKLNYKLINFTFRNLAKEKNMDFWELCEKACETDEIDIELDQRQVKMAMAEKDCVLGSRLAIWMLKEADVKIYLLASTDTRINRIFKREGGSLVDKERETKKRDESDTNRYKRIYNIDNNDTSVADLVIDTDDKSIDQITSIIIDYVKSTRNKYYYIL